MAFATVISWDCPMRLNFVNLSFPSPNGPPGSGLCHGNFMRLSHEIELGKAISFPSPPGSGLCQGNLMRLTHGILQFPVAHRFSQKIVVRKDKLLLSSWISWVKPSMVTSWDCLMSLQFFWTPGPGFCYAYITGLKFFPLKGLQSLVFNEVVSLHCIL
jgi:hypothetical protein